MKLLRTILIMLLSLISPSSNAITTYRIHEINTIENHKVTETQKFNNSEYTITEFDNQDIALNGIYYSYIDNSFDTYKIGDESYIKRNYIVHIEENTYKVTILKRRTNFITAFVFPVGEKTLVFFSYD